MTRKRKGKAPGAASSLLEASIRELQPDDDDGTVKPARTTSGGGGQRPPTIGGRVWEGATLPPSGERRRQLSGPPLQGRDQRCNDDERLQTAACRGLPSRASFSWREQTVEEDPCGDPTIGGGL